MFSGYERVYPVGFEGAPARGLSRVIGANSDMSCVFGIGCGLVGDWKL